MDDTPRGLLFLCVANSARSQLAEALARELAPPETDLFSAGSAPTQLDPLVVLVLSELGLDAAGLRSKSLAEIPAGRVGTVVTLCAEELCPAGAFSGARRLHWPLADPARAGASDEARLEAFRATRDEIQRRLREMFGA